MHDSSSFRALERTNRRRAALLIAAQILLFALFGFGFDLISEPLFSLAAGFGVFPGLPSLHCCSPLDSRCAPVTAVRG